MKTLSHPAPQIGELAMVACRDTDSEIGGKLKNAIFCIRGFEESKLIPSLRAQDDET